MTRRLASLATAVAAMAVGAAIGSACYDVPLPACGFHCGEGGACPEHYTCNETDRRCHLDGTSPDLVCPSPDAGVDASADAPVDAI